MSKVMLVVMLLLAVGMAFSNGEELRIVNNLKPIAENNCLSEGKTFTGLSIGHQFYYCNGEVRGFLISELNDAKQEKAK